MLNFTDTYTARQLADARQHRLEAMRLKADGAPAWQVGVFIRHAKTALGYARKRRVDNAQRLVIGAYGEMNAELGV